MRCCSDCRTWRSAQLLPADRTDRLEATCWRQSEPRPNWNSPRYASAWEGSLPRKRSTTPRTVLWKWYSGSAATGRSDSKPKPALQVAPHHRYRQSHHVEITPIDTLHVPGCESLNRVRPRFVHGLAARDVSVDLAFGHR